MQMRDFKQIAIWGYGREGKASLAYLRGRYPGAAFYVIDDYPQEVKDFTMCLTPEGEEKMQRGDFDLIVKSPGISLYRPVVAAAKEKGAVFTSSTNLWFAAHPDIKTIGVTGTKGKSTTSSLLHHILLHHGVRSALAGNIGVPLLSMEPGADVTVLELSSYQIADLEHGPDVAILLNLYPEHRDWHGSTERYYEDKKRIAALSDKTKIVSNEVTLSPRAIHYEEIPWNDDMPEFFKGAHNRRNLGAALAAIGAAGFVAADWMGALQTYQPLPHRQEVVADIDGIRWINDSISTVPETAMAALALHVGRPVTLILGGQDRGQDYSELAAYIRAQGQIKVLTLPDNGARIAQMIDSIPCETLAIAVATAAVQTPQGGVVLLSPAAPSYGHFKNFEDRGNQFRTQVLMMRKDA